MREELFLPLPENQSRASTLRCRNGNRGIAFLWSKGWVCTGLWRTKWLRKQGKLSRVWLFCDPRDYGPPGSSVHGTFQGIILECHSLLQGIFPTQGLNPHLLHWQVGSVPLSHQQSPSLKLMWFSEKMDMLKRLYSGNNSLCGFISSSSTNADKVRIPGFYCFHNWRKWNYGEDFPN